MQTRLKLLILFLLSATVAFVASGKDSFDEKDSIITGETKQGETVAITDSLKTDSVPVLKRWFKDFPTVYTDTAYIAADYVVVFKCNLMNHNFGKHRRTKNITNTDPANTASNNCYVSNMVRFSRK